MASAAVNYGNKKQKISLERNNIAESTKTVFMDKDTADFWFLFGSGVNRKRIPVHKVMLAKESEPFKAMFYGKMKEKKNEVQIVDANDDEFTDFLRFFYEDSVTISIENVAKIMYLAKKYLVIELLKVCDEFIIKHLPEADILFGYDLAILYDRFELKTKLEEKISENAKKIFATDAFRECSHDMLKSILDIGQLMCNPKEIFDACIDWAKNAHENYEEDASEMENIKKQLGQCLYQIPFYLMNSEQITQIVNDYEELFDRDEFVDLINMMTPSGRTTLKKFKYKDDFALYSKSNFGWWYKSNISEGQKQWIKKREIVQFKYQAKYVLIAMDPFVVWHKGNPTEMKILSGAMKIVQMGTADAEEVILLKQPIEIKCKGSHGCTGLQTIKFAKPFILEPSKAYEVQFNFDDSWIENTFYAIKIVGPNAEFTPLFRCANI